MHLRLPLPATWTRRVLAEDTAYRSPDGGLKLLATGLTSAHEDPVTWMAGALMLEAPAGTRPSEPRRDRLTTDEGWPALLLEARLGSAARLVAYFEILDYAAGVIVHVDDPERAGWRDEILAILRGARPDLAGPGVLCLAHLLEGIALAPTAAESSGAE
jgi:hypothetical protein